MGTPRFIVVVPLDRPGSTAIEHDRKYLDLKHPRLELQWYYRSIVWYMAAVSELSLAESGSALDFRHQISLLTDAISKVHSLPFDFISTLLLRR